MTRFVGLVSVVALLSTSACTMTPAAHRGTILGGAASAVSGLLLVSSSSVDANHNGYNETALDDNLPMAAMGSLLVVAGVVIALAGLASTEVDEPPITGWTPPSLLPGPFVAQPAPTQISLVVPPTSSVTVAVSPSDAERSASLPELPATAAVLQLAKQVRTLVRRGQCDGAWQTLAAIAFHDVGYAEALATSVVVDACPRFIASSAR